MKPVKQGNLGGFHLRWVAPEAAWRVDVRMDSRETVAVRSIRKDKDLTLRRMAGI